MPSKGRFRWGGSGSGGVVGCTDEEDVGVEPASLLVTSARDGELQLTLDAIYPPEGSPWAVPAYRFHVVVNDVIAGTISLRVGMNERLVRYAGHVGFSVMPEFRGRRLAGRSVGLLLPLAKRHGLQPLWLSCNPDNQGSRRVMAWLGATYVETVDLPADYDRYTSRGERQKERYRLDFR